MSKIQKNIISWILYIALLGLLVWGTPKILSLVLKTSYPMASITSSSMWPALKQGDMVFIKGAKGKENIQIGDIVVYQNERGFTIHRLVRMNEKTFITKGDANNIEDVPVAYDKLIGKTVEIRNKPLRMPYLGNISILINKTR